MKVVGSKKVTIKEHNRNYEGVLEKNQTNSNVYK